MWLCGQAEGVPGVGLGRADDRGSSSKAAGHALQGCKRLHRSGCHAAAATLQSAAFAVSMARCCKHVLTADVRALFATDVARCCLQALETLTAWQARMLRAC